MIVTMNDEKVLPNNDKLQKLRSMMNRIHASHSDRGASSPSYDLNNDQNENERESIAPIVYSNDDQKENHQHSSIAPIIQSNNDQRKHYQHAFIVPSNDNSKTTNIIISVLFRSIEPVPFDPNVDSQPDACFNCRRRGYHRYKQCTIAKNYEFCLNCGRRGVEVKNCPRCYKANQEFERTRRPVELLPPQKCNERSGNLYECKREKSRTRTRVRNFDGSREYREKSRHRQQNYKWPEDSRGAGLYTERKSREERNPNWDKYTQDNTLGNHEEEYNNIIAMDEKLLSSDGEPVKDFTSELHKLMAAIRHLPNETQAELLKHFVKERQALINSGEAE